MTKADLADAVYQRHGALSRRESMALVEAILERVQGRLAVGESVKISGFGSFSVVTRRQRMGRNPRTGTIVTIPGRRSPVFRPSRLVVQRLNENRRSSPPEPGAGYVE